MTERDRIWIYVPIFSRVKFECINSHTVSEKTNETCKHKKSESKETRALYLSLSRIDFDVVQNS